VHAFLNLPKGFIEVEDIVDGIKGCLSEERWDVLEVLMVNFFLPRMLLIVPFDALMEVADAFFQYDDVIPQNIREIIDPQFLREKL